MAFLDKKKNMFFQKNILILGSGLSALSAVNVLKSHKLKRLFLYDPKKSSEKVRKHLQENIVSRVKLLENKKDLKKIVQSFSCAILSPGISLKDKISVFLIENGIPIISEIELSLLLLNSKKKIIGITGTNGKSTTTSLLTHVLEANKKKAISTGNFGMPLGMVAKSSHYEYFIVEMSSYQIETTFEKRFDATLFLNISDDHLERYGDIETYFKTKWKLILLTKSNGFSILSESVFNMAMSLGLPLPESHLYILKDSKDKETRITNIFKKSNIKAIENLSYLELINLNTFTTSNKSHLSYVFLDKKKAMLKITQKGKKEKTLSLKKSPLFGEHNLENLAFAVCTSHFLGLKNIEKAFSHFKTLAHRFEKISIKNKKNLGFINDSKSTNLNSLEVALRSVSKKVHLLMGGQIKEESFENILSLLKDKVIKIYPFGESAHFIYKNLKQQKYSLHKPSEKMSQALLSACIWAKPKDSILFSPGGSSFDEFKNFEHRGQSFVKELERITRENLI